MKQAALYALLLLLLSAPFSLGAEPDTSANRCGEGRIALSEAPEVCPCCGFSPVAAILYGRAPLITEERKLALEEGRLVRGGCVVRASWTCTRCGAAFYQAGEGTAP